MQCACAAFSLRFACTRNAHLYNPANIAKRNLALLLCVNRAALHRVDSGVGCGRRVNHNHRGGEMGAAFALIVEDDQAVAELFQKALQDAGYQVEILENGHKAQAQLVFTTPDLILLDLHLPNLSGEVILRQIRGQQRLSQTRIIVTTGDREAGARYVGMADEVIIKPVGYELLRQLAEKYLPVSV
jgi:CheY-like chemotaxis protein